MIECVVCDCAPCQCNEQVCYGCNDDMCPGCEVWRPMFELEYGASSCLVGPCTGEERDELIKLWGREPDAGRVVV